MTERATRSPWWWVPSLYLAEGLPYIVVQGVATTMYKNFGVSNTNIALLTSWLYLPWVVKPLWSPVVDILGRRRAWVWGTQVIMAAAFAGVAFAIPGPKFLQWTLAAFWLMAINSATHDIAADGFYLLATSEHEQSFFVGIRTMFYRGATLIGSGPLVILAGTLAQRSGDVRHAWTVAMLALAALFVLFGLWHRFILPRPVADRPGDVHEVPDLVRAFLATFGSFFARRRIVPILLFLLLYRFGEAQLVKLVSPFLLDPRTKGGLALTTAQVGWAYGTVGVIALTVGGVLGGWLVARHGLKAWLWPMLLAIHLPDAVFIFLASAQPTNLALVTTSLALEQFGYGFGFTAYVMYMIHVARGPHPTAHYAICTGFMALGMMIPGMWSGWLQDHIGYRQFFSWVILATIPSFLVSAFLPLEAGFGKQSSKPAESAA